LAHFGWSLHPTAAVRAESVGGESGHCQNAAGCFVGWVDLKWHISHVRGFLELGMVKEAKAELDAIAEPEARRPEVVALRVGLLQAEERWRELRRYARSLAETEPGESGWWILWAFAARRAATVRAAEKILLEAEVRHPQDATIQFNLGCYACQEGDLSKAKERVLHAIALDSAFLKHALEDPDLQPLRDAEPDWINGGSDATQTEA